MMKYLLKYINFGLVLLLSMIITSCRNVGDVSITAHVWEDINSNQAQDPGEKNLQEIDIQILNSSTYTLWSHPTTNIEGMVNEFAAGGSCDKFLIVISVPRDYWPTTPVLREIHNCEVAEFGLRPYP
jgi:hypothetical protein